MTFEAKLRADGSAIAQALRAHELTVDGKRDALSYWKVIYRIPQEGVPLAFGVNRKPSYTLTHYPNPPLPGLAAAS